ncbi:hypothetical protein MMC14_009470 [Varicellaria rhodocarpa]|nr:hypothetical protein [Varicellaria rhodocarpa]
MTELEPVLARLGIVHYLQAFLQEGFDTWETVLDITESDLDVLKVKLGHRRASLPLSCPPPAAYIVPSIVRLQREIANARGLTFDQLIGSTARGISNDDNSAGLGEERYDARVSESKAIGAGSGKRKYRRHPKPDENAPDRPPSAYVIFSNKIREDLKPLNLTFTEIAKRVGESWQVLSLEEKETYESQASALKERYTLELIEYKKTLKYHEYAAYLADFKAKHSTVGDGKRPRLESRLSPVGGGSSDCYQTTATRSFNRIDSASSATTHSSVSGQPSPKSMPPPASKGLSQGDRSASPASLPPTPPLHHKAPGTARVIEGVTQGHSTAEVPSYQGTVPTRGPSLPRIVSSDVGVKPTMVHGILPPLVTDTATLRTAGNSQVNPRRSQTTPAPFLGHDASKSSLYSSRSSDMSGNNAFTPITPIDETGSQRTLPLPLPSSISTKPVSAPPYTDTSQPAPYSSILPQSSQPYTTLPSLQSSYIPLTESGSKSTSDIFNERQSMRNLSLGKSSPVPNHHLRSHSRELHKAQQNQDRPLFPPRQPRLLPHDSTNNDHRSFLPSSEGNMMEAPPDPQGNPLSVLAYVGRMVDRESRKPP